MRHLAFVLVALLSVSAPAGAVTIRDLIELTKAGLGEEVLLALVEVDGGVFPVDAATLRSLKEAGVPESVIAAVVRSGRTPPAPPEPLPATDFTAAPLPDATLYPAPYPAEPEVVYLPSTPETVVQEVPVPYYVPVLVPAPGGHRRHGSSGSGIEPSIPAPPSLHDPPRYRTDRPAPASPTYWGNGGKLRPDAWQPAPSQSGWGRNNDAKDHSNSGGRERGRGDGDRGSEPAGKATSGKETVREKPPGKRPAD